MESPEDLTIWAFFHMYSEDDRERAGKAFINEKDSVMTGKENRSRRIVPRSFVFFAGIFSLITAGALSVTQVARLEPSDKAALAVALLVKAELGEEIWPGFGRADIPAIIYDEAFEYLVGDPNPPEPWRAVDGDDFLGKSYFRRPTEHPQSFAVDLGSRWAGSLSALSQMTRKIPWKLGPDWWSVGLIHEMFHAFQAESAPEAFAAARAVYALESRYPFKDKDFAADWNAEGAALSKAMKMPGGEELKNAAAAFLGMRDARRAKAGLSAELIGYERRLEWLEGLGKYAEIRADELAVGRSDQAAYGAFRSGLHFLVRADFARLENALGRQDGDLRFYLSGMAMGRMLDRLDPAWKNKVLKENVMIEDLLRRAGYERP